jgi:hypothetical protein
MPDGKAVFFIVNRQTVATQMAKAENDVGQFFDGKLIGLCGVARTISDDI